MSYETLAWLAKTVGLIWLMGFFILVVIWVFRPGAKSAYRRAARSVLSEKGKDDER